MSKPRRPKRAVDGILLLDKPQGITSNAALMEVRRLFQADKAGHTGSLDPMATGLLPICLGNATKLSGQLLASDKAYRATIRLGTKTDSGDADGAVIASAPVPAHDAERLSALLQASCGPQQQVPPMVSALKHEGQRLYALAREGVEVERAPRDITIHRLTLVDWQPHQWTIDVQCSKGTYIRVLAEDLAAKIGALAHLGALHRQWVAPFDGVPYALDALRTLATDGGLRRWTAVSCRCRRRWWVGPGWLSRRSRPVNFAPGNRLNRRPTGAASARPRRPRWRYSTCRARSSAWRCGVTMACCGRSAGWHATAFE